MMVYQYPNRSMIQLTAKPPARNIQKNEEKSVQFNTDMFQALDYRPTNRLQQECIEQGISDLGTHICNNAAFHVHITGMATLCKRVAGLIFR